MAEYRNKESETTQDRTFELRSEKVRSIVGQIPSRLIRYGTMVIAFVLLTLVGISIFLPYRKVTSGTLIINNIEGHHILNVSIQLSEPTIAITAKNCPIQIHDLSQQLDGVISTISKKRDSNGRNTATIHLNSSSEPSSTATQSLEEITQTTMDYRLTLIETTILKQFLHSLGIK